VVYIARVGAYKGVVLGWESPAELIHPSVCTTPVPHPRGVVVVYRFPLPRSLLDREDFHYNPPPPKGIIAAAAAPQQHELCCARFVALLLKRLRLAGIALEPSSTQVIKTMLYVNDNPVVASVLVPALKHYSSFWVAHAEVIHNDGADEDGDRVSIQTPVQCSSLIRAMFPLHSDVVSSWEDSVANMEPQPHVIPPKAFLLKPLSLELPQQRCFIKDLWVGLGLQCLAT
jgi:hypothetical protein